jgi:hypothetical protein
MNSASATCEMKCSARPQSRWGINPLGKSKESGAAILGKPHPKTTVFSRAGQWSAPGTKQTKSHAPHEVGF